MRKFLLAAILLLATSLGFAGPETTKDDYLLIDTADGFLTKVDAPLPPGCKGIYNCAGGRAMVTTQEDPKALPLSDEYKRGFIKGMAETNVTIRNEAKTTFRGLDAYRFDGILRTADKERPISMLLFVGNGFMYSVAVFGSTGRVEEGTFQKVLDHITLTKAEPHKQIAAKASGHSPGYDAGYQMGRDWGTVVLYAMLGVAAIMIVWLGIQVIKHCRRKS